MAKKRKHGRPRQHDEKRIVRALEVMAELGISLKEAAAKVKVPYRGLKWRIANSPPLTNLYARARDEFADEQVHRMQETAKKEPDVNRARLICDNIKWYAQRVLPRQYGERQQIEVEDKTDQNDWHSKFVHGRFHEMTNEERIHAWRHVHFLIRQAIAADIFADDLTFKGAGGIAKPAPKALTHLRGPA